jgi:hypothetical protein
MKIPTVGFVIPMKPKHKSNDWDSDCAVLEKTLESILNQTSPHYRVYVVYHDLPLFLKEDLRITYVPLPFAFSEFEQIPHSEYLLKRFKTEKMAVRRWDKGRKVTYGSSLAVADQCSYIMSLDADDRVSKYLVRHIEDHSDHCKKPGWMIDKGYVYKEGTSYLIRVPEKLYMINGSSAIIKADLIRIPDFSSTSYLDYNFFTDHGWVYERLKDEMGVTLEFLQFPAIAYIVHSNNVSHVDDFMYGFSFRKLMKRILRGVRLTPQLQDEFTLR